MKLSLYQIDAFAELPFEGNLAAVVPLTSWLNEDSMQKIAEENNLAETAFFVATEKGFHIRWFTPKAEVKLCGHATLASAFVLFNELGYEGDTIIFDSLSGPLAVTKTGAMFILDFPSQKPEPCETPDDLIKGLGKTPVACFRNTNYVALFSSEHDVATITPDPGFLKRLDLQGVCITAKSEHYDFVACFFAPKPEIPEDPVTGSAYTQLTPLWTDKLLLAQQKNILKVSLQSIPE